MKLTIDTDYRVQWEGFGTTFAFTPPHNYFTGEVLPEHHPKCDMPAIMVANPSHLHPVLKTSSENEVGLYTIVDF